MGIRGFNTFVKKISPDCFQENDITKYSGKRFGIDASILMYKYRHISNIDKNFTNSHIIGFINRIKYYLNFNITPIFIFDGVPPEEKRVTLNKRQSIKHKIYEKIEILEQIETSSINEQIEIRNEINKLSNQIINVSKTHIEEIKRMLDILKIDYFNAPDEAEKYCVYLLNNDIIDYIVSDDTDIFTYGCNKILKSSVKNKIIEIDITNLLAKLEYSYDKFIDFCILSGCDYVPYVPNLAINTVYTLFKKCDKIEDVIALDKYKFPPEYNTENLNKVRLLFKNFNYSNIAIPLDYSEKKINLELFINFLKSFQIKNYEKILEKFK